MSNLVCTFPRCVWVAPLFFGLVLAACEATKADSLQADPPQFERDVRPIFIAHCYECHIGHNTENAGLDLRSVDLILKGSVSGPVLVPGSANKSPLVMWIERGDMPPSGKIPDDQIETIKMWIDAGAPADDPRLVYGAGFFQSWGPPVLLVSFLNLIVISVASSRRQSKGYYVMFAGMAPVFLLGLSTMIWFPPDPLSWAACSAIPLGLSIGGAIVALEKGYRASRGIYLTLFLLTLGIILLARLPSNTRSTEPATAE